MTDPSRIRIHATSGIYDIDATPEDTVLEALRRVGLPALGYLLSTPDGRFVSLADRVGARRIDAQALRNPDLDILSPQYELVRCDDPVAEIFDYAGDPPRPVLRQLDRDAAADHIFASVSAVLDTLPRDITAQIALSSGGDGRALAESVARYRDERRALDITAVITSVGFEDPVSHVREASAIADRFGLAAEIYDEAGAATLLGYQRPLADIARDFSREFPRDELEALGTYWVQQVNLLRAEQAGRQAVLFGYNMEDVIADRLYQLLSDAPLPPYPIRRVSDEIVLVAPLSGVPKRVIDAIDLKNSMRNYAVRVPSGSYLRSALYFIAYHIVEKFPPVARALASEPVTTRDTTDEPSALRTWLARQ